jgi:hypothetical protein
MPRYPDKADRPCGFLAALTADGIVLPRAVATCEGVPRGRARVSQGSTELVLLAFVAASDQRSRNEEAHVMPIHAEAANRSTTVDAAKLLEIVRRWCPAAPVEVPITLVRALIEAAASSSSGQLRLGLLEGFVLGLAAQLCSNSQKLDKLKKETARMAGDPLRRPKLRPGHPAELAKAALAAVARAKDKVLSVEKIHTALRRVKPKIRPTSTYALVKRMTDCGWLERVDAGVYGLPSRSRKPYEPRTLQLLRLVYTAPDHEMGTRQARAVLDWSPKLLGATVSELCSRNLLKSEKGVLLLPREIVEKLARGEGVPIAPGKVFYARAGSPIVDDSAFTALRAERLPLEDAEVEAEIERLKALPRAEYEAQREPAASRLGVRLSVLDRVRSDEAKEEVGRAIPQQDAAFSTAPSVTLSATRSRQAAEKQCKQLLIERHQAYLREESKERPLKDELKAEMTGLIPKLSARAFDRSWKATAVAKDWDWKDPGVRKPPQKTPSKDPLKK